MHAEHLASGAAVLPALPNATLIGDGLALCLVPLATAGRPLSPTEELVMGDGATLHRRQEVVAGRQAAHAALNALGIVAESIGRGVNGEPLLPQAVCGSISHCQRHAVAIVGLRNLYGSVGVDIDDGQVLGEEAAKEVTWEVESRRVGQVLGLSSRDDIHSFTFSAKEAIYKCQAPVTGCVNLRQTQARLLPRPGSPGHLAVSGWRVSAAVAQLLTRVTVYRMQLAGAVLAIAVAEPAA